jgi:uncharacterized membrane protein YoaT (DUF817 family)
MLALALCSYINFMSKFFIPDLRYVIPLECRHFLENSINFLFICKSLSTPMLPVLLVLAFIIWIAENISTFYKIWLYPSQVNAWHMVGWGNLDRGIYCYC